MKGYTLLELLVSLGVTLVVLGSALALVGPASEGFHAIPEHADTLQRLRTAAETLAGDLSRGTGGGGRWPPILPCGWGGDPVTGAPGPCARPDAVTVVVPQRDLRMTAVGSGAGGALIVARPPGCPAPDAGCVFTPGDGAIFSDGHGRAAPLRVLAAADTTLVVSGLASSAGPPEGAVVAAGQSRTYYTRWDAGTEAFQLRRLEGDSDVPVVDHLGSFQVEYFGAPEPPALRGEAREPAFGPAPVRADAVGEEPGGWLESCAFAVEEGQPVSRLRALPAESAGLARLALADFLDGPWCADPSDAWRVDLDAYRVVRVRVTLGVQAASARFRGTASEWFRRGGTAKHAGMLVPDLAVTFDTALGGGAGR